MTTRQQADIEEELRTAAEEIEKLETAQDVRDWWSKHYYTLGHRRMGRLLLGQSVARMLEQAQRSRADD